MASVTERITALIEDAVKEQGVSLWDVRFVKEGASHYLRIFIDKPEGIDIDDCTNVSHAVDPILDEADPIDCAYYLEVCSPGLERELTKDFHFEYALNKNVKLKLFKGIDGKKEFEGILREFNDKIIIEINGENKEFDRSAVAKAFVSEF